MKLKEKVHLLDAIAQIYRKCERSAHTCSGVWLLIGDVGVRVGASNKLTDTLAISYANLVSYWPRVAELLKLACGGRV